MAIGARKPDFDLTGELEFEEYAPRLRAQAPRLRPDTEIIPQTFRGKTHFVLQDPATLQFYRVGETEREILAQLDGRTALGEIHERLQRRLGSRAPSFRELAHFVVMLRHANLTVPETGEEARWSVERASKKRSQQLQQRLASFMYLTLPLLDPDRFLDAVLPYVRWVYTKLFFAIWLGVVAAAVGAFFYNASDLVTPANGVLAPQNLAYLWLAFMLIKACHELGHAFTAKRYGAQVHRMGVMFLIFMPCLYVDTTAVWAFPRKWPKVLVGAGGMMTELFIASLALFAWIVVEPGAVRTILYNMIFVASVSTLLFNGNPLLRYDAYYILADLVEIPNLRQRSSEYLMYVLKRYLIGERVPRMSYEPREKAWFVGYGILSVIYRSIVVVGIVLFIASKLFFVGIAMALVVAALWVATPLVKLLKYLFFDKGTRPVRARAVGVSGLAACVLAVLIGVVPAPVWVRAPCALEPYEKRAMRAEWPGFFSDVRVKDGDHVQSGQVMAVITNDELDSNILSLRSKIEASEARHRMLETQQLAAAQAEQFRLGMLRKDLELLRERKESLTVRAPFDGEVIAPDLERTRGRFVRLGDPLFTVASLGKLRVLIVVNDTDVAAVRNAQDRQVRAKFASDPSQVYVGAVDRVYPSATHDPPPPALTNAGGGQVLLDPKASEGQRTLLPWYRVDVVLEAAPDQPPPPVGTVGIAQFVVGSDPLGKQFWLHLRRMLHRRFLV